ncbi:hypothetical protein L1887_18238 [Cichorium endivia]|nr:hypothetical protein L1887_18238 [Cichorium endivia]
MVGNKDITMADSTRKKKKKSSIISHLVIFFFVYVTLRRSTLSRNHNLDHRATVYAFPQFQFRPKLQPPSWLLNPIQFYKINRTSIFDFLGKNGKQKISRSPSVIGHAGCIGEIPENTSYISSKGSQLEIREEPFGLSLSQIPNVHSDSSIDMTSRIDHESNGVHGDREEELISNRKQILPGNFQLPSSAASFYYRCSPCLDVVECCESIQRLNSYLKACKDAVNAGVPGQFFRAVLGQVSDAGSFISTIMYSFYLNETDKSSDFCTVPVINIKRADLKFHGDLEWLLNSCNIDQPSILFIDEVDLSYYNLFGSLKIVLLNADKLPEKQEALKESLVEIFKCQKGVFPDLSDNTDEKECSCCALIAEKFASISPEIFAGKGFSRLLLAERLQKVDKNRPIEAGKAESVGMSAVGMSISQLLSHNETSIQEIVLFQQMNKLRLLIIVSSYHNRHKNFKEMLISAESEELMEDLLRFFDNHPSRLQIRLLYQSGLCDEMRAFTIDNLASMTIMEQLLQDFCRT